MPNRFMQKRLFWGREARLGLGLSTPTILIMGGLVILPLIVTVIDSFFRVEPMKPGTPFVGLKNYVNLMVDGKVLQSWVNTFIYVLVAVTIETLGGLGAALVLHLLGRLLVLGTRDHA